MIEWNRNRCRPILEGLKKSIKVMRMNKKWLGWLLLAGLVGVTAVFFLTKEAPRTPIPEPVEAVYELTPTLADQGGMDVATAFSLKHPETVAEAYLQEALSFSPEIDFEIERVSPAEVVIKPLALLKEDQVYQVALRDQPLNSWAFQTKKQLKEIATLPGDRAQYVATDSGVEIQFNFKDLENFEEAFEITPAVSGTFSRNGYSQIFIPDALEARTTYRVTLDSDLRVAGSDITLGEDLSFSFTTAAGEGGFGLTLKDEFFNYTTAQNHFVPAYMTEGARAETYALAVYAYPDPQMFLDHLMALEEGTAMETLYEDLSRGRQALAAFDTRPEAINLNYDSFSVFEMPRPLEEGHYLVRISLGDRHWYGFIQVNDLLVYSARFEESQLFWVSDAGTHEGVPGAEVALSEGPKGLTDQEGIALVADKTPRDPEKPLYATVHKEGRTPFVMRSVMGPRDWYESSHGRGIQETSNDYFKYLYTDRSTYLPTDQVAVFGYLKPRTDAAGDYTLQFISRDYGEKVLQEADLPLTLHGTFTQTFNFKDLAPGAYTLLVKAGEETLLSRGISVTPYIKPLYRLSGDFTRDYFTRGQEVVFEVEAAFFDGTPAVDMPLDYSAHAGENHQGRVETDQNGRGTVRFTPDYETDYWRPQAIHLDLYNAGAEDMRISLHDSYTYFPKDTMIRIFSEDSTGVRIEVNELVAGNYDEGPDFTLSDLKGAPLDRKLKIEVVEHYFEKVEKGTRYDYINKVNRPLVEYQKRERVVESLWAATVEGVCFHETPYLEGSDSSFEMTVTLEEEGGRILETAYLHDGGSDNWINPDFNFYTLEAAGANEGFKLGETVDYRLTDQGEPVVFTDDRFLVMTLKEGLVDYRILQTPEGNMTFEEAFLPNVHLKGVLLREGMLTRTFDATLIKFDPSEREADITVTADAPTYLPGGMVELRILTRDGAGEPVSTDVNVSVVDEAYFALYQQGVDFLKDLYAPMDGTGIQREFVSTDLSGANFDFYGMAEGGGPEGDYAIRRDFKDTALFMTLSTDDKGEGLLRFALPDNLTSWRVTYQGINDKMEAASGKLNLTTALPFYMVPLVSQVYLTGDEPAISLRVFGEAVDQGAPVAYRVALDGETRQAFGPGGDYTRIPLGRLAGGTHTLLMTADQEGYGDGMEKTLEVKDSTVTFNYTKAYSLGAETVLTPVESVAGITFRNQSESPFIATLFDLVYGGGQRVDQKLGALGASAWGSSPYLDRTLKRDGGAGIRRLPGDRRGDQTTALRRSRPGSQRPDRPHGQ